jgi:7-cyano-7-deazaguanine reductase
MTGDAPLPATGVLGRHVDTPRQYDPTLLFAIPRAQGREALRTGAATPFIGSDRWHAYELSWLDRRGKPCVATAHFDVPATTPNLVESKSLKLYLNAFNGSRFDDAGAVLARIGADLSGCAGGEVDVAWGLPAFARDDGICIDGLDIAVDDFGPPNASHLRRDEGAQVEETLHSALLKSNCPVTGQPDWASVRIAYRGPRIDHEGLLRYLVSFREHCEFHEQCVERIFSDVMRACEPHSLCVEARYTRRGGLDINPWRATPDRAPPPWARDLRQ